MVQFTDTQKRWVDSFRALEGLKSINQGPPPVNGNGFRPPTSNRGTNGNGSRFYIGEDGSPNAQPAPLNGPPTPAPKHEVKIEVGKGVLKGAVVLSTERGPSGVSLSDSDWQAFQQKTSLKLGKDVVGKFETKLLNGETELGEIIDGLTVDVEVSGGKMDVSSKGLDVTLMTVTIKLKGDITKWLADFGMSNPSGIKIKLTGQIQANLGSIPKWKEKVAKLAASHVDELLHAEKIGKLTGDVDDLNKKRFKLTDDIEKLRKDELAQSRLGKKPDTSARKALEAQRDELNKKFYSTRDELKKSVRELEKAKGATDGLRGKLKSKLDKAVAKVMATKAARVIGKILLKALPIINIISTILDIADLIKNIKNLFKKYEADGAVGGDDEGEKGKGSGSGEEKGPTDGPVTSPRQVDKNLPPTNGTPSKTPDGTPSKPGEQQKGEKGNDTEGEPGPKDGPITSPRQVDKTLPPAANGKGQKPTSPPPSGGGGSGPITKPSQVKSTRFDKDPRVVLMRDFADNVAAQWFTFQGDTLVITPTAMDWIKANVGEPDGGLLIKEATPAVVKMPGPPPGFVAKVHFEYLIDGEPRQHSHSMTMAMIQDKLRIARGGVTFGEPDVDPYKK